MENIQELSKKISTKKSWFIQILSCFICGNSLSVNKLWNRPCVKESTEVRKSQNKEKESENSYQKLKRSFSDSSISGKSFHCPFPFLVNYGIG